VGGDAEAEAAREPTETLADPDLRESTAAFGTYPERRGGPTPEDPWANEVEIIDKI
jgi:hypothetical protein